jgi:hypothetical protein
MKSAYNTEWLYNLAVIKETKRWVKQGFITGDQLSAIQAGHPCGFYHPNFIIRIVLFVASLLAMSGVLGLFAMMVSDLGESTVLSLCVVYGIASFIVLEVFFIRVNHHYKSGVTEAVLYHACGFTVFGLSGISDGDTHVIFISCIVVFSFSAIRYLDIVTTFLAVGSLAGFLFYEVFDAGGVYRQVIPFAFIVFFTPLYFSAKALRSKSAFTLWDNNLVVVEALSLLLIYVGGNYLVVRELSTILMDLYLIDGEDIPYAYVFYFLTVMIPLAYLFFGIKNKDIVLLRVSLFVLAFSVFTFKYYYGFGHPEISLTIAGVILIAVALFVLNYLKTVRHGYTRENLLEEKWGSMNIQGILISQTMGGNQIATDDSFKGGGGGFSGGGASGEF